MYLSFPWVFSYAMATASITIDARFRGIPQMLSSTP